MYVGIIEYSTHTLLLKKISCIHGCKLIVGRINSHVFEEYEVW